MGVFIILGCTLMGLGLILFLSLYSGPARPKNRVEFRRRGIQALVKAFILLVVVVFLAFNNPKEYEAFLLFFMLPILGLLIIGLEYLSGKDPYGSEYQ